MWLLFDMEYKIFTALHLASVKALFLNSSASSTVTAMPRIYLQARFARPHGKLNVVSRALLDLSARPGAEKLYGLSLRRCHLTKQLNSHGEAQRGPTQRY